MFGVWCLALSVWCFAQAAAQHFFISVAGRKLMRVETVAVNARLKNVRRARVVPPSRGNAARCRAASPFALCGEARRLARTSAIARAIARALRKRRLRSL